jgi:hypothetical protein
MMACSLGWSVISKLAVLLADEMALETKENGGVCERGRQIGSPIATECTGLIMIGATVLVLYRAFRSG